MFSYLEKDFQRCPEDTAVFDSGLFFTIFMFFFSKFLINTKNLSSAAILIFRRCFRSNSLSVFHKTGVLLNFCEILRKEYMSESVFNNVVDLLAWNFKLKTASRMFFNELRKNFKNTFLEDTSRLLLLKTWHSNF